MKGRLCVSFDVRVRQRFQGDAITSDAGLPTCVLTNLLPQAIMFHLIVTPTKCRGEKEDS